MKTIKKILINTRTSGKFKREQIDGRPHLVTTMMPIRGDITMNKKFFSDEEVGKSFMQLNMLPAPNGHPTVNGIAVSAFHPVANNKHNIGGFLRNPRKKGKRVFVDFMLDEEIANNSDEGKEVIRRIEAGEKIGVSTGLTIRQITNKQGEDDFGKAFNQEVFGFNFDHVAILLNEAAAGEHAGTELVLNEAGEDILVCSFALEGELLLNELSTSEMHEALNKLINIGLADNSFAFVIDVFPESKTFIFRSDSKLFKQSFAVDQNEEFSLLNDRIEGSIKEEFIPVTTTNQEVDDMDKSKIVLAIIGNSANKFTVADNDRLMAMSDPDLNAIISTSTDANAAKQILTNSGFDFTAYDNFVANKAAFETYLAAEETKLTELKTTIVASSDYTTEMLKGKSVEELTVLNSMIKPETKVAKRIAESTAAVILTHSAATSESVLDFT